MDLEDFIVSNNLLPLGSLVYLTFCVTRYGCCLLYTSLQPGNNAYQKQYFQHKRGGIF